MFDETTTIMHCTWFLRDTTARNGHVAIPWDSMLLWSTDVPIQYPWDPCPGTRSLINVRIKVERVFTFLSEPGDVRWSDHDLHCNQVPTRSLLVMARLIEPCMSP